MCVCNSMFIKMTSENMNVLDVIYGIEFDVKTSNPDDISNSEYKDVFKDIDFDCSSELSSLSNEEEEIKKPLEVPSRKHLVIGKHIEIIDGEQKKYKCTICKCQFSWKHQIRYHDYCLTGKRPLKCELCDKRFVKKSHLVYHLRTHSGESPYQCSICPKKFKQMCKLKRHEKIHRGPGEAVKLQCRVCEKNYCDQDSLKKHELKHDKSKTFQCKHCKKKYGNEFALKQHVATHQVPKFICEVCGRRFRMKNSLNIHLQMHEDFYPHQCPNCRKTFRTKKELNQHMVVHDESNPGFECSLCSVMFGRKDNLLRHVRNCHLDPCAKKEQNPKKITEDSLNNDVEVSNSSNLSDGDNVKESPATPVNGPLSLTGLMIKGTSRKKKSLPVQKKLLSNQKGENKIDKNNEIRKSEKFSTVTSDTTENTIMPSPSFSKVAEQVLRDDKLENMEGDRVKNSTITEGPVDLSKTESLINERGQDKKISSTFAKTSVIVHTSSLQGSLLHEAKSCREPVIKFCGPPPEPKSLVPDPT